MKKILAFLLIFVMLFTLFACGSEKDDASKTESSITDTSKDETSKGINSIYLGGSIGEFNLEGAAFGTYNTIDFPEGTVTEEGVYSKLYYSEDSYTKYIAVYRWAKEEGETLESVTAEEAEKYGTGEYEIFYSDDYKRDVGYYTVCIEYSDGKFYYKEAVIAIDGDEFFEIDFFCVIEELQLGNTGGYIFVPAGYTSELTEDDIAHDVVFYGEYPDGFDVPNIWVGKYNSTYEYEMWIWGDIYPDGLPMDEATYNSWLAQIHETGLTDELWKEYYETLGCTYEKTVAGELEEGVTYYYNRVYKGDIIIEDITMYIGEECYNIFLASASEYDYVTAIIKSFHKK